MPSLAQVRTRVDDWLTARWPTVLARQDAYFTAHGVYWQGLRSTTLEPAHTTSTFADVIPDRMSSRPTDQGETWMDFLPEINGLAIPAVFIFDVYISPQGHGYVASVLAKHNGTVYMRSQNVGPLTERTVPWQVLI